MIDDCGHHTQEEKDWLDDEWAELEAGLLGSTWRYLCHVCGRIVLDDYDAVLVCCDFGMIRLDPTC
jgi:hypothetical protein